MAIGVSNLLLRILPRSPAAPAEAPRQNDGGVTGMTAIPEVIAQEIDHAATKAGRALADHLAQHFQDGLMEFEFERHQIADYIFRSTATEVLDKFHALIGDEKGILQVRAMATVKAEFNKRLAELCGGDI